MKNVERRRSNKIYMNFFGRIFGGSNNDDKEFAMKRPNKVVNFWVLYSKGEYTGKQGSVIKDQ